MRRALESLADPPDALLTDAIRLPEVKLPAVPLIKGDQKSLSIAAASILAKVSRDQFMDGTGRSSIPNMALPLTRATARPAITKRCARTAR